MEESFGFLDYTPPLTVNFVWNNFLSDLSKISGTIDDSVYFENCLNGKISRQGMEIYGIFYYKIITYV